MLRYVECLIMNTDEPRKVEHPCGSGMRYFLTWEEDEDTVLFYIPDCSFSVMKTEMFKRMKPKIIEFDAPRLMNKISKAVDALGRHHIAYDQDVAMTAKQHLAVVAVPAPSRPPRVRVRMPIQPEA